jgi:hypothetical protein
MNYNKDGIEANETERVFAMSSDNEFGTKHYILFYGGEVVDPGNMPHRNLDRLRLRSVTEPKFKGYLSFLVGKEQRKFREINRDQHV